MEYWFGRYEVSFSEPGGSFVLGADPSEHLVVRPGQAKSGRITLFLRSMSPIRAQLSGLFQHQEVSASRWEQNTIEIRDRKDGRLVLTCREVAFATPPQGDVFTFDVAKLEPAE